MNKKVFYNCLAFIFLFASNASSFEFNSTKYPVKKIINKHVFKNKEYININLKLEINKETFSPNNDNIDDTVTFSITAPKDKSWTLDISSFDDKEIIEDGDFKKEDLTKIFTGIGTGKPQQIIWDGKSTNKFLLSQGKYNVEFKTDKNAIIKKVFLLAPERIKDIVLLDNSLAINYNDRINRIKNLLEMLVFEDILSVNKPVKILKTRK